MIAPNLGVRKIGKAPEHLFTLKGYPSQSRAVVGPLGIRWARMCRSLQKAACTHVQTARAQTDVPLAIGRESAEALVRWNPSPQMAARAIFSVALHHSRSSISVAADSASSASPASTS